MLLDILKSKLTLYRTHYLEKKLVNNFGVKDSKPVNVLLTSHFILISNQSPKDEEERV